MLASVMIAHASAKEMLTSAIGITFGAISR
jgi:hypothetical protein